MVLVSVKICRAFCPDECSDLETGNYISGLEHVMLNYWLD